MLKRLRITSVVPAALRVNESQRLDLSFEHAL